MAYKGTIYKLCCRNPLVKELYVGSTKNLKTRESMHRSSCKNNFKSNLYNFIREHGGYDNWEMVVLEDYNGSSRLDLLKRERHWLESFNSTLNIRIPSRTFSEYQSVNKVQTSLYNRQYYLKNKDHLQEEKHKYYLKNKLGDDEKIYIECECKAVILAINIEVHEGTHKHKKYLSEHTV